MGTCPHSAPIRVGSDSVLVGFGSGMAFHALTRVRSREGLDFWVHQPALHCIFLLHILLSAFHFFLELNSALARRMEILLDVFFVLIKNIK